ncbi:hypothetical protein B0H34DRAFT_122501 [Crassisporium funariophilum]|nr:hypothetical protein B0H34DRAFT_122501 [Crassisporium funariophilum]
MMILASKPPLKRRKLVRSTTPSATLTSPPGKVVAAALQTNKVATAIPVCTSCHRAMNINSNMVTCSRCCSTTCSVCSRTCTASAASQPPTPHLTWSPTPSPSPTQSPRRSVLSLNSPNTNLGVADPPYTPTPHNGGGKRKNTIEEDDQLIYGDEKALPSGDGREQESIEPGCGRVVCRNCCFENIQKYARFFFSHVGTDLGL